MLEYSRYLNLGSVCQLTHTVTLSLTYQGTRRIRRLGVLTNSNFGVLTQILYLRAQVAWGGGDVTQPFHFSGSSLSLGLTTVASVGWREVNHCFRTLQCHTLNYSLCCICSHAEKGSTEVREWDTLRKLRKRQQGLDKESWEVFQTTHASSTTSGEIELTPKG